MKYIVLLCDGMADDSVQELGGLTPMQKANKPNMDRLARSAVVGMVKTVPDSMKPGSDVANLSVLGYDPELYYTGRSPLEAGSLGIDMLQDDVALRCNLVTLSGEENYSDKRMEDYCAGDISSGEARELVEYLAQKWNGPEFELFPGVSYRHCLIWHHGNIELGGLVPPHDISGKTIGEYLPSHPNAGKLLEMMKESTRLLEDHPVNLERKKRGLHPANAVWFWGEGEKARLPLFKELFGLKGSIISAVDLLKGIGHFSRMNIVNVPGATGYLDTNFEGKADAAADELDRGQDFVYIHVEAPDECGHRHEIENKVKAIEWIDQRLLSRLLKRMEKWEDYKILILPDHPTPLAKMTHTGDPVPFLLYQKNIPAEGVECFCEESAAETGVFVPRGPDLLPQMLKIK